MNLDPDDDSLAAHVGDLSEERENRGNVSTSFARDLQPIDNLTTLRDILGLNAADHAQHAEKSIVINANDWRYATANEIRDPRDIHVIPLIKNKWSQGVKAEKFVINKIPSERKFDWDLYEERIDTSFSIQGTASQWQKALLLKTIVGEDLHAIIVNNNWLSKEPMEGVMHYDLLKKRISDYFKASEDPLLATRRFMECKQSDTESMSDFALKLERARLMCGISLDDNRMRVALIAGARNDRMRTEAEGAAHDFNYQALLNMGERIESAEAREAELKRKEQKEVMAVSTQPSTSQGFRGGNAQFFRGGKITGSRGGFSGMRRQGQGGNNYQFPGRQQQQQRTGQPWRPARGGYIRPFVAQPGSCLACGLIHAEGVCGAINESCGLCSRIGHYARCCKNFATQQVKQQVTQQQVTENKQE